MRPKSQRASSSRLAEEARCPLAPAQKMLGMSSYNILEGGGGIDGMLLTRAPCF